MIPWLTRPDPFPPVSEALEEPEGLLAAGADLSPERLIDAYRQGIFPWFGKRQPVLWWCPNPRMVLFTDEFRVSRTLRKKLRKTGANSPRHFSGPSFEARWEIRCDSAFAEVMRACSDTRPGQDGTWIAADIIEAYCELHRLGIAHSVETWADGRLIGGLYGVSIGKMFYGESMFARFTDASKVALAHLVDLLRSNGFPMIDCQQQTSHLASMGARPIARDEFSRHLRGLIDQPALTRWPARLQLQPDGIGAAPARSG